MTPATTTTRRAMPDVDTVTAAFDVEGAKVALEHALVSAREALERAGVRDFDAFFRDVSRAARDLTTHDVSKVLSVDVEAIFRDFGGGKVLDVASHASHAMQEVVGGDASGFALEALQTAKSAVPKEMLDTVNENPEASTAVATLFTAITALSAGSSSSSSSSAPSCIDGLLRTARRAPVRSIKLNQTRASASSARPSVRSRARVRLVAMCRRNRRAFERDVSRVRDIQNPR